MVDVQTVSIAVASVGVFAAAIYYIFQIRHQDRMRHLDLFTTYENIEQLFRSIVNRASKNKEDEEETLTRLFEMLEPFAGRPIGNASAWMQFAAQNRK